MHKCVRCGRAAASLKEINDGCPCGSKVFVFNKEAVQNSLSIAGEEMPKPQPNGGERPPGMASAGMPGNGGDGMAAGAKTPGLENAAGIASVGMTPSGEKMQQGSGISVSPSGMSFSGEKTVMSQTEKVEEITADGKMPESYHARMTFSSEDVENIKVVTEGVFMLELHSLYRDPVVLKDEEGVYYVKIPIEQKGGLLGIDPNGNGKKKK